MGWVSYREDVIERFSATLVELRVEIEKCVEPAPGLRDDLLDLVGRAEKALAKLMRDVELATDPEVNLAAEVSSLEGRKRELLMAVREADGRLRDAKAELAEAERELAEVRRQANKYRDELKAEKKKSKKLDAVLKTALQQNPEAVYEQYSSPDRIRRLKKDKD